METTEFPKSNSKWLFCNCINGLKNISSENKAFALEIFRNEYNISKRNSKKIIKEEKVELWMLLTLLLHMNLINDLSHLSLAQWVGRPTNVWHPLASDITNITSSSNHYIPIEISQWCIFFPLEAPGSSLQSYPTLLQGEWLEWRHWFPFPRAKRAGATPKKGKRRRTYSS